ncbi:MAG: succinyldiaminopimelate transaminase [Acidiferrobacterales bacterium]
MNSRLSGLQPYPFQRLAELMRGVSPPPAKLPIRLSIGEPQHAAPRIVLEEIGVQLHTLSSYPTTRGLPELRDAAAAWANRRHHLDRMPLDPQRHVLPVNGTREALFSIVQAVIDPADSERPVIILPNPFYQIYEGAALLAGAEPYFLNTVSESGYRMDFDAVPTHIWKRTRMVFVCSPGNPTGAVMERAELAHLIELAQRHDFLIISDECYSEIYFDEQCPPPGILQAAHDLGIADFRHCLAFQSLSKRSNLPGLRSGIVAGDGLVMEKYLEYRTYHGCSLSSLAQAVSIRAWNDEDHVRANRDLYRAKFDAVLAILTPVLDVERPQAGFYLWPRTPQDDERFARELYERENVLVLPGSYLSRTTDGVNPGHNRVRMALVAPLEQCVAAAHRIRHHVESACLTGIVQ